jgi:aminomethyltransferase
VHNNSAVKLWDALFAAGKDLDIKPIGLGARDTLRLEKGFCLYGNDIDDTTSPIEAGLGWITKTKKEGGFVNVDAFKQQITEGVSRKLVGFTLDDRRVPRHGYEILDADGNVVGIVTSGTSSPSLDKPIGLGYVKKGFDKAGSEIFISFGGGKKMAAKVVKLPFL